MRYWVVSELNTKLTYVMKVLYCDQVPSNGLGGFSFKARVLVLGPVSRVLASGVLVLEVLVFLVRVQPDIPGYLFVGHVCSTFFGSRRL